MGRQEPGGQGGAACTLAAVAGFLIGAALAAAMPTGASPSGRTLFRTYGPEQGLLEPTISCLAQDERSFLWIGTETGLVRYDGSTFRTWTSRDGLPASWVTKILPARGRGLWLVTSRGLARFVDGTVTPARFGPTGETGNPNKSLVDVDRSGRLWVLRRDAVYRESEPGQLEPLPGRPAGRNHALACSVTSDAVYVAIGETLYALQAGGSFTALARLPIAADEEIDSLAEDGTGRLWAVAARRLAYLDPGGSFVDATAWLPAVLFEEGVVSSSHGSVLVPTNAGLLVLRGDRREVVDRRAGLPSKWVRAGLVDSEGNLWVAGANLYRRLGQGFVQALTEEDGLPNDVVWVVRRVGERLLVGTNDGVAFYAANGWHRVEGSEGYSSSAIEADQDGHVWLAFSNGPLLILDRSHKRASPLPLASLRLLPSRRRAGASEGPGGPYALLCDRDGTMLVGDDGVGLFRVDLRAKTLQPEFTYHDAQTPGLVVLQLAFGHDGKVVAATSRGLLQQEGRGWRLFTPAAGLPHTYVGGVLPEADGSCWLWYQEPGGLDRVAVRGGRLEVVEHLDTTRGLASDHVYAAVRAPDGALWVAMDRGVDRIQGSRILHFGRGQGLVGEDCCANGTWCDADGTLWVGTANGLARIDYREAPATPHPPSTLITHLLAGRVHHELPLPGRVRLGARDATVELRWATPSFVDETAIRWDVRMLGLEDEWRQVEQPVSRYGRLPGGRFRFEVRARYAGGPPGPVAALEFEVDEVWWRTWPAVLVAGLVVLAAGAGLVRLRLRVLTRQKVRLERLVAERTEELREANRRLESANRALEEASLTDPLTGLRNRRYLALVVEPEVARVTRLYASSSAGVALPNQDLVFLMIDLDHFKAVNDSYGHAVGDEVLRATARALEATARSGDTVVRWGGEEFLLLAHGSNRADAPELAERVRSRVAAQVLELPTGARLRWTCSVGFAALPFDPRYPAWLGWERVVDIADAALYLAKGAGRNTTCGLAAGPGLEPELDDRRLPHDVAGLLAEGRLCRWGGAPGG